jgi:hypothetical protein
MGFLLGVNRNFMYTLFERLYLMHFFLDNKSPICLTYRPSLCGSISSAFASELPQSYANLNAFQFKLHYVPTLDTIQPGRLF